MEWTPRWNYLDFLPAFLGAFQKNRQNLLTLALSLLMVSSHCLICGSVIVSGLYCHSCLWEIKKIRLRNEVDLDTWIEQNMHSSKKISFDENIKTLDSFNSP